MASSFVEVAVDTAWARGLMIVFFVAKTRCGRGRSVARRGRAWRIELSQPLRKSAAAACGCRGGL